MKKYFLLFTCVMILFSSCVTTIPLIKSYYNEESRLGILYVINELGMAKEGSQGLLDMALTPGAKYKKPLEKIEKSINTSEKVRKLYTDIFTEKGKIIIELDDIPIKDYSKFIKPNNTGGKKYHKYDLRKIKDDYEVDELLIIDVNFGILVSYYGFIELDKNGYCNIKSELVNLQDNSYLYKNNSLTRNDIDGGWNNPPEYESLSKSINESVIECLNIEKNKLL